jgi:hypothetical protein
MHPYAIRGRCSRPPRRTARTVLPTAPPPRPRPEAAAQPAAPSVDAAPGAASPIDIERVLEDMGAKRSEKLNWRTSIVDLLKLVGMDASFSARKELADELGYSGDKNDTATMNLWLHKQVMQKLAANGGKVPADLLS